MMSAGVFLLKGFAADDGDVDDHDGHDDVNHGDDNDDDADEGVNLVVQAAHTPPPPFVCPLTD